MALTRVDCFYFRGRNASLGGSSYLSLNPHAQPGSFVAAGASATRSSIGGQVATKLALDHFADGILNFFDQRTGLLESDDRSINAATPGPGASVAQSALESAFKSANSAVYSFAHSLAAGGRLFCSLAALIVDGDTIAAGRVGFGGAYLCRAGDVFPFFESIKSGDNDQRQFLGANSLTSVELASVSGEQGDILFLSSLALPLDAERELASLTQECRRAFEFSKSCGSGQNPDANPCALVSEALYDEADEIEYAMLALIGPETIYLDTVA